ncbi:MAG: (d)CMP kinase [Bacillota bacterium]
MKNVIAIDGPAAAGKSTLARAIARQLDFKYLDTGAMYRALTWLALKKNIDLNDPHALSELARNMNLKCLPARNNNGSRILINDREITSQLRIPAIDNNVSKIARVRGVREAMVQIQRQIAAGGKIVMDGRDIGSRVLPDAEYKFFITASLQERAIRRYRELKEKNPELTLAQVKEDIKKRDHLDKNREVSPLVRAEDARLIDTTELSIEEVVSRVKHIIEKGETDG